MTGQRKLSDAQIVELIEKREKGWSHGALADWFGISKAGIHYQCLKAGAISPNQRIVPVPTQSTSFVAGDGRTQRRFTQAEDVRLLELEAQGLNYSAIAVQIGRARTSVRIRIMTLALREGIAEAAA